MIALNCPHCDAHVPLKGTDEEWCEECGKHLPLAVVAAAHAAAKRLRKVAAPPGEVPYGEEEVEARLTPAIVARRKLVQRVGACAVYLVGLASFFGPWGWMPAVYYGLQKNHSLCAASGCLRPAEVQITYRDPKSPDDGPVVTTAYCTEHANLAPRSITWWESGLFHYLLPILLSIGALAFACCHFYGLLRVFQERKDAFWQLVVLTMFGVFLVNGVTYAYWIYS